MKIDAERVKKRYDDLKATTERGNWESHCEQIADVISPRQGGFTGIRTPGEKKHQRVFDSTPIHANEMLAAGLHGMATNPAARWFSLRMVDDAVMEKEGVKEYLSDVEEVMWSRIYSSGTNITTALHEAYLDLGAFGTAIIFVGQRDDGGLMFQTRHLHECVVAENDEGVIDTVMRCTSYTVRQMVQMFGEEGVSEEVRKKYIDKKFEEPILVIHAVYPNDGREYKKKGKEGMAFISCYFEHKTEHKLKEGGFPEFPYLVPRWYKLAGEVYGRGPGMVALPDAKMLQAMMLSFIKLSQKNADPPLWMRDEGILGPVRTVPGGVNYLRGRPSESVMLMPTSLQGMQALSEHMEGIRERIRTVFFTNVMQFAEDSDMTATEVRIRSAEKLRAMGPLVGRMNSELLGPLVARVYGILERGGLLPQPPEMSEDVTDDQLDWEVEFVSPIALAQRQTQAEGPMQVFNTLASLGPEMAQQLAMQRIDPKAFFDWLWDLYNCDPDLLQDEEAQAQTDAMAQAQQAMQVAGPAAGMAQQGAGALKGIADAQASAQQGGIDLQSLIQGAQQGLAQNPQAGNQVQQLLDQAGVDATSN